MGFCPKCGTQVDTGVQFCPKCGQAQGSGPAASGGGAAASGSGLEENVAALLSYVLGWLTGLIFFLVDKRPYVKFHAAQSIVVFGGLHVAQIVLGVAFGILGWAGWTILWAIYSLMGLAALVLWVLLMIKAYQNERFRVPLAAEFADKMAGS